MSSSHQIGLLTDFNAQNLAVLLQKSGLPGTRCFQAPFAQTMQTLLNPGAPFWAESFNTLFVWTLPQQATPEFQRVCAGEQFSLDQLLGEVDAFAELLKQSAAKA